MLSSYDSSTRRKSIGEFAVRNDQKIKQGGGEREAERQREKEIKRKE